MSVKIRLTRMGAKKAPFYRIIVTDSRKSRDGQYIEKIGHYDPTKSPVVLKIDAEKAQKWLSTGAQMTDTVRDLFYKQGILAAKKVEEAPVVEAIAADKKDEE